LFLGFKGILRVRFAEKRSPVLFKDKTNKNQKKKEAKRKPRESEKPRKPGSMQPLPQEFQLALGDSFYGDFLISQVPKDGDCFFSSLALILRSFSRLQPSASDLRKVLAASFLDPENLEEAKSAVTHFINIGVWPKGCSLLKASQYVMDRNQYWAEEYAIRQFQKQLGVQFIIVEYRKQGIFVSWVKQEQATHLLLLYLSAQHYQPLFLNGKSIFDIEKPFPESLEFLLKSAAQQSGWVWKGAWEQ